MTLNLQKFGMPNEAAKSKFKGKHLGNFDIEMAMGMDKNMLSLQPIHNFLNSLLIDSL